MKNVMWDEEGFREGVAFPLGGERLRFGRADEWVKRLRSW